MQDSVAVGGSTVGGHIPHLNPFQAWKHVVHGAIVDQQEDPAFCLLPPGIHLHQPFIEQILRHPCPRVGSVIAREGMDVPEAVWVG